MNQPAIAFIIGFINQLIIFPKFGGNGRIYPITLSNNLIA